MDPATTILTIVGWLMRTLVNKAITALLEEWAKRVGLGDQFKTLKDELIKTAATLESARGCQIKNNALLILLKNLQQLAYEADDLLHELEYYRIQHDIELNAGNSRSKGSIALRKLGPFGGDGGGVIDMDTSGVTHISNIGIRHGDSIDALILRYQGFGWMESTHHWGGHGGQLTEITLQPNECIMAIRGHVGLFQNARVVRSLEFETNFDIYGPFGKEEGTAFELSALGGQIIGFYARCGLLFDAIGIYVKIADSTGSSSSSISGIKIVGRAIRSVFKQARCQSAEDVVEQLPISIPSRSNMSNRMKKIVQQLRETSEDVREALKVEAASFTIKANQDNQAPKNNRHETTSYMTEKVYGREQEQDILINKLVGDEAANQTLSVIAIVGHGGIGKTTLAQLMYKEEKVKTHFNLQMWITVSVNFDVKRLTKEILEIASGSNPGSITNLDKLQTMLLENLEGKRFLLVLDDLWEDEDTDNWERLLAPLRNVSNKGNVVLVTTRKPGIENLDRKIKFINLDGLEKDTYWFLFKACTFGDEMHAEHPNLEDIGREIVEKLKGNPLAAKTVGALLKKDLDESHWWRIRDREEWKHQDDIHGIMPALRISYDYLSLHLQRCFSYCALFPKDYKFMQRELVNIWIAQGFIYVQGKRLEEVGKDYLDDLVDSGFFQKIHGYFKKGIDTIRSEDAYIIHDLLHDLAQNVSLEECLSLDGRKIQAIPPTTRHLSILTESLYEPDETENWISKHLQPEKLSTIMFFGDEDSIGAKTVGTFQSKFKDANALRVLRLQTIPIAQLLLSSLLKFTHLQYLQLCSNYSCDTLPVEICRLYHLQVLDVRNWKNLLKLPNNFNNLVNLRHFIPWNAYLYLLIAGVGKLAHLQELHLFGVRKEREFGIGELRELKELRGELIIDNLENVKAMEEAKGAVLVNKTLLNSLQLSWDRWESSNIEHAADADVLEGLRPHHNLKKLRITGYGGATSPRWLTSESMLTYLEHVILYKCMAWKTLPHLGQLPRLKRLELKSMSTVKEIGPDLYGCGQHMAFQCLEEMVLQEMPTLMMWIWNDQCQNLPALLKLSIYKCPELELILSNRAPEADFNKRFPHLVDLQISKCPKLPKLPPLPWNNKISTICTYNVGSFERVTFSNSELSIHNPIEADSWDDIRFHNLGEVTSLEITSNKHPLSWENMCFLAGLQKLSFMDSPILFSFPNKGKRCFQLTSLNKLKLVSCGISGKQLCWMLQHVPVLSELLIEQCHKIKSIGVETKMNEPNMIIFPVVEVGEDEGFLQIPFSLTSLQKLFILNCPDMVFESKGGISGLLSIRVVEIADCSMLLASMASQQPINKAEGTSQLIEGLLPPKLQHLTMNKVPEGTSQLLEGLSSLNSLTVHNSPELKSLELTSCFALEELHFLWCPKLASLKGLESLVHLKHLEVGCSDHFVNAWICASDIGLSMPLKILDIDTTTFLAMPICKQLTSLQRLIFRNEVMDLTNEQEESLLLLTSLKAIHYNGCKNLRHLPAKLHLLPSIEELIIHHCLNVQSPPEKGLPKSLKKLGVYGCGDKVKKMFEECEKQLKKRRW